MSMLLAMFGVSAGGKTCRHGATVNVIFHTLPQRVMTSGAGTIFQQGGQDQPFPAGGLGGAVRPKRIFTTIF